MPSVDYYADQIMEAIEPQLSRDPVWPAPKSIRTVVRQTLVDLADHSAAHRDQIVEGLLASDDNIEVECCGLCPLMEQFDDRRGVGATCMHHTLKERPVNDETMYRVPPPDWCPLRVQPMRIFLKEAT